jgi:hypothetical protein
MAYVKITIEVPTDLNLETAQRINEVCRAVMRQFPGVDEGPQNPCRMFLTTLATFGSVLEPKTDALEEDGPSANGTSDKIYMHESHSYVREFVKEYTAGWPEDGEEYPEGANPDRGRVLTNFLATKGGALAMAAFRKWTPVPVLLEAGATKEQAGNIVSVASALQIFSYTQA